MEAEASADTGESVEESVPEEEVSGEAASEEESVPDDPDRNGEEEEQ